MNPISGVVPVMDAQTMKELMGVAVAAQTQQATKTAIAAVILKVFNPSTGLGVWAQDAFPKTLFISSLKLDAAPIGLNYWRSVLGLNLLLRSWPPVLPDFSPHRFYEVPPRIKAGSPN